VKVSEFGTIPTGMDSYTIKGGLYAVFIHTGTPEKFYLTLDYIYNQWLPGSDYLLDNREHFDIMQEGYNPDDPLSEEEIWVPVRIKGN